MIDNTKSELTERTYDLMELLPSKLRLMLTEAPFNFSVVEILDAYGRLKRAGMCEYEAVNTLLRNGELLFSRETKRAVLDTYGPNHPQANENRNSRLLSPRRQLHRRPRA